MRPHGSPTELEVRRRRAICLVEQEYSLHEVARRIGCDASSVMRWRDACVVGGTDALRAKPIPGRPPRLNAKQKERLVRYLLQGAMAHGYRTELWTTQRIADLIEVKFAVRYHRDHVGRLMHELAWTPQKPERRAIEHNDEAVEQWKRREWPRIKKRREAGCPSRLYRRIRIPPDPERAQDLGAARPNPGVPLSLPARQDIGHLGHLGQPRPQTARPVLPALYREHPPGRSL
jgi:transposase